jgi:hypothetical protein
LPTRPPYIERAYPGNRLDPIVGLSGVRGIPASRADTQRADPVVVNIFERVQAVNGAGYVLGSRVRLLKEVGRAAALALKRGVEGNRQQPPSPRIFARKFPPSVL